MPVRVAVSASVKIFWLDLILIMPLPSILKPKGGQSFDAGRATAMKVAAIFAALLVPVRTIDAACELAIEWGMQFLSEESRVRKSGKGLRR
jgi:hypothetical protein